MVIREGLATDLSVKMKNKLRPKGRKFDGKSRVSTDLYRKRWNEIFKKKTEKEKLDETKKLLEEIADRNGF